MKYIVIVKLILMNKKLNIFLSFSRLNIWHDSATIQNIDTSKAIKRHWSFYRVYSIFIFLEHHALKYNLIYTRKCEISFIYLHYIYSHNSTWIIMFRSFGEIYLNTDIKEACATYIGVRARGLWPVSTFEAHTCSCHSPTCWYTA